MSEEYEYCHNCGGQVHINADVCLACGVFLRNAQGMALIQQAQREVYAPMLKAQANVYAPPVDENQDLHYNYQTKNKKFKFHSKFFIVLLMFMLGGFGIHRFWLGGNKNILWGGAYLVLSLLSVTVEPVFGLPVITAIFVEFLWFVCISDAEFDRRYNS